MLKPKRNQSLLLLIRYQGLSYKSKIQLSLQAHESTPNTLMTVAKNLQQMSGWQDRLAFQPVKGGRIFEKKSLLDFLERVSQNLLIEEFEKI